MPSGFNPHNTTQDWETVVLRGKGKNVDAKKKRDDVVKPQRINPKIKERIVQARTVNKISQKELAQRCQVQPTIVQQYENGKAKADVNVLRKMERVLKVKLTGKEFNGINV